jgi:hypothetical protein
MSTERDDSAGGGLDTFTLTDAVFAGVGFGFCVEDMTVAESAITPPFLVAQLTVTTRVNCADAPFGSEAARTIV